MVGQTVDSCQDRLSTLIGAMAQSTVISNVPFGSRIRAPSAAVPVAFSICYLFRRSSVNLDL